MNGLFIPNNQPAAPLKKGDQVRFKIRQERGKDIAVGVEVLPEGSVDLSFLAPNLGQCRGWILVEANNQAVSGSSGVEGSGVLADGVLMVVEDKTGEVTQKKTRVRVEEDGTENVVLEGEAEEKEKEKEGDIEAGETYVTATNYCCIILTRLSLLGSLCSSQQISRRNRRRNSRRSLRR